MLYFTTEILLFFRYTFVESFTTFWAALNSVPLIERRKFDLIKFSLIIKCLAIRETKSL